MKRSLSEKKTRRLWFAAFAVMVCGFFIFPLYGEDKKKPTADTDQPIRIKADKLLISRDSSVAEFVGNVKAVQGNTTIKADKLKVHYKEGASQKSADSEDALEKIVASGNVKINFDNRVAVTNEAVYITENRVLILTGPDTRITSGKDTVVGEKITFRRDDGYTEVEGGKSGPVTMELFPGKNGLN